MSAAPDDSRERLGQALETVRQARQEPPSSGKETFRQALQLVIDSRNRWLGASSGERAARAGAAFLHKLNSLLSLMTSVEFPLGGYHAERMDLIERELGTLAPGGSGTWPVMREPM